MEAGEYILGIEVDWRVQTIKKSMNITCYGPQKVEFVEKFEFSKENILRSASYSILEVNMNQVHNIHYLDLYTATKKTLNVFGY